MRKGNGIIITARSGELEGTEADVVEGFVVEDHALVGVFNELMDR